ncbi:hypothetical protein M9978_18845 [Sphingomonas sp. MG17]|uniref:Uncharacterized protein n=1 Tax=Sphingomonas tagetis TaxID=2949092 RepID=A0A9X2HTR2_9SPHN|nr:hypothetical protein [Sphingomonas tagetis]MCP3732485.1 hypothetical protein [Sphingomonas tagetis]
MLLIAAFLAPVMTQEGGGEVRPSNPTRSGERAIVQAGNCDTGVSDKSIRIDNQSGEVISSIAIRVTKSSRQGFGQLVRSTSTFGITLPLPGNVPLAARSSVELPVASTSCTRLVSVVIELADGRKVHKTAACDQPVTLTDADLAAATPRASPSPAPPTPPDGQ